MRTVLTAAKLLNGTSVVDHPAVLVEDGLIASIHSRDNGVIPEARDGQVFDFPGATLAPARPKLSRPWAAFWPAMEQAVIWQPPLPLRWMQRCAHSADWPN
jgi:hypothetical protein